MTDRNLLAFEATLVELDPILGALIKKQTLDPLEPRGEYFASLARSIIGQQVSVAAARAISGRFADKTLMNPEKTADLTDEDCKQIGLSKQKASYIRDLARHFVQDPNIYNHLETLSDEDVIADLTAVKGIGVWTAQMFLLFTLGREDVFAPDDVGLQRAMLNLYQWEELPPKKELILVAEKWKPYRSVASRHLWHSLDNTPA